MAFLNTVGRSLAEGWWMLFDTGWALALGFALSGAVQAFVSKAAMQRSLGDHRPRTVAKASLLGVVSSSCSYAASALAKSLFAKGADFTASMAFMFASTNLVLELGAVLWLLVGWQFALAEFVGGAIMIGLLSLVLPRIVPAAELTQARAGLQVRGAAGEGADQLTDAGPVPGPAPSRLRSLAGWSDAAGFAIGDLTMLRTELFIGFTVAGFAATAVPVRFWQGLFLTGHGWLSSVENVAVAPVLAFVSFVCSVGNVPLAAALWRGGISFGGVVAFIFADLLALPLVLIYRKYYGTRLTVRLALVFWAVMSAAGLITEALFQVVPLIPTRHTGLIATARAGFNATTILDLVALVGFACLYWLYRNRARLGGGTGLAKDPVCGMQVRTHDAPARASHAGAAAYFCSDRCREQFVADPSAFSATASAPLDPFDAAVSLDPVCGMSVRPDHAAGRLTHRAQTYWFCSTGCCDAFATDPERYLGAGRPS